MENLKVKIDSCTMCNVNKRKASFYGNVNAKLLFVAQNAGRYKPKINPDMVPFNLHDWTDKARGNDTGDVMKSMLTSAGFTIEDFGITNLVKCFIDMSEDHIFNCSYWLNKEIRLMPNISLIVCLGKYSGEFFGHKKYGVIEELIPGLYSMMIFHPGFMLRRHDMRNSYKKQFERIKDELEKL